MKNKTISGRTIGVTRLVDLLHQAEGGNHFAVLAIKRELGIKGNRDQIIAQTKECLRNVGKW